MTQTPQAPERGLEGALRFVAEQAAPALVEHGELAVLVTAEGATVENVTPWLEAAREQPNRTRATVALESEEAFVAYCQEWRGEALVRVFAHVPPGGGGASVEAVIGYDTPTVPSWRDHRVTWAPALSEEWLAWSKAWAAPMGQRELAEFIEDRLADLVTPGAGDTSVRALADDLGLEFGTPAQVIAASRGLEVSASLAVRESVVLSTGASQVQFVEEARATNVTVPGLFAVAIPLWEGGTRYLVPVRLRWRRKTEGEKPGLTWTLRPHGIERIMRAAKDHLLERLRTADLVVFEGEAPPAYRPA
jgi:uncharacterized protein YfdQ (DUF2303 family)